MQQKFLGISEHTQRLFWRHLRVGPEEICSSPNSVPPLRQYLSGTLSIVPCILTSFYAGCWKHKLSPVLMSSRKFSHLLPFSGCSPACGVSSLTGSNQSLAKDLEDLSTDLQSPLFLCVRIPRLQTVAPWPSWPLK